MMWLFLWMATGAVVLGYTVAKEPDVPVGFLTFVILWLIWPMILGGLIYEAVAAYSSRSQRACDRDCDVDGCRNNED